MTASRLWALTVLIIVVLLASLAFVALRLSWHRGGHTSILPLTVDQQPVAEQGTAQHDTIAILALAPFGTAISPQAPQQRATAIKIDVLLRGVLLDPDPTQSRAFLLTAGSTKAYGMGDEVQSAELVAINADTITLRSETGLHVVGFNGLVDGTESEMPDQSEPVEDPNDPFARLAAALVPGNGSIDLRPAPPAETTDEYINLWRDRISQNPQAAMDTIGVEVVENGYRIKPDPNIGVTLAGLRPGDVVTKLNGQTVGDLASDRQLYDQVAASGIARLEVFRDGKALLLTFPLR